MEGSHFACMRSREDSRRLLLQDPFSAESKIGAEQHEKVTSGTELYYEAEIIVGRPLSSSNCISSFGSAAARSRYDSTSMAASRVSKARLT